ncbi:hypothetical protein QRD89_06550 [Halobacillus sp. ACCC02827]|uniref:hypothetical protein n=1 Tax=unclassified Halobacillus TaxID=2636472 RepID=UPI0002A521BB|nr:MULTISPECIES: hypothetical protein [unclassified Halobacillus]ELK45660.1 hypothetical protein D479_14002 [Halobacillus sp. BAB-2008]WJE17002.1 hypothetical protein QRD89_06550 [Halobacillus sp. ACCC02827]
MELKKSKYIKTGMLRFGFPAGILFFIVNQFIMRGGVGFTVAALLDFLITVVLFTLVGGFFGYGIWKGKRDQQETE